MTKIRVSKEFTFEMAHALYGHDGPCKNIHGHSYHLTVCMIGEPASNNNSDNGMVIDFSVLKKIVKDKIVDEFDHSLVINKAYPFDIPAHEAFGKIHRVNFQPTCENLLGEFINRLKPIDFGKVTLHSLCLRETATSFAEWFHTDNIPVQ